MPAANQQRLSVTSKGTFTVDQPLDTITIMGVAQKPKSVKISGKSIEKWTHTTAQGEIVSKGVKLDMNQGSTTVTWS